MAPRARPPHVRSVQTPQALQALRAWVAALPTVVRDGGEKLVTNQQVEKVWAGDDQFDEARVMDDEPHGVTLFLTLGKWSSRCSCSRWENCQHTCAAALAWSAESEARAVAGPNVVDDSAPPISVEASSAPVAPPPTFI